MAMAMRREKAPAMLPEPRPDLLPIRLRNLQPGNHFAREKFKPALRMRRRQRFQFHLYLEQEHQPMRLPLKPMLADQSGQVQVGGFQHQPRLFMRLPTGAHIRRFPNLHLQLAPARTPKAAIRLLRPLEQQYIIALIKTIEQRGDLEI